jgi:hypothetical protein
MSVPMYTLQRLQRSCDYCDQSYRGEHCGNGSCVGKIFHNQVRSTMTTMPGANGALPSYCEFCCKKLIPDDQGKYFGQERFCNLALAMEPTATTGENIRVSFS